MAHDVIEVQITCGDAGEADRLADALVRGRLAACVQQLPIVSTYRWRGAIERDAEILLLVKTTAARLDGIRHLVADEHSYDVPALTVLAVVDGSEDYLAWVDEETSISPSGTG